jgi:hypothetical protein
MDDMSDESHGVSAGDPAAGTPEATPSEAATAWREVVSELDALGDAVGRWARAAVGDPENRRRLDELSTRLEGLVSDVGTTVKGAADSEVGQSFREAAGKTGEAFRQAGEKLSEELGPRLSGAFRAASEHLSGAASRMEERTAGTQASSPDAAPGEGEGTDGCPGTTSG